MPYALLSATLDQLELAEAIDGLHLLPTGAVLVEWTTLPSTATVQAVDAAIAAFAGGETDSAPLVVQSFAVTTATTDPVEKIRATTPPRDGGTYQVIWNCMIRMQAVAANTGVEAKIRLTRSDGAFVEQVDSWDLNVRHAFNGAITFTLTAGQTLEAVLTVSRLGASGTAEMSGARISFDKLS